MTELVDIASLLLAGLLGMLVGGNNLSASSGTIIGSGMISKRSGILLAVVGYLLGLALEGPKLFKVREAFLPNETTAQVFIILLSTLLVFLLGEMGKIPQSLSKAMTGAIVGVSLAAGAFQRAGYLALILGFWLVAPLVASGLGLLFVT